MKRGHTSQKCNLIMAVTLTVVLIFGAHVAAHSSLGARNPRENQIVAKMPKDISLLVLDEGVGNERDDFVRVWDSKGQNIASKISAAPASDGTIISAPLLSNASGWYVANWSIQFSDGHISSESMPAWWAFGVGVKTVSTTVSKFDLASSYGTNAAIKVSISGLKVGLRKLSIPIIGIVRGSVEWTLVEPAEQSQSPIRGAQFSWTLMNDGKSKTVGIAQGILPAAGKYLVVVSYQPRSLTSKVETKTWSGWVSVTP